jgi:hypothetical protein
MLGVRPNLLRPARPSAPPTLRIVEAVTAGAASPDGAIEAAVEAVAPVAAAPPPGPLTFEAARDALKQRYPAAAPVRFLWRTDADDRLVELSPPLAEVTGAQTDALIGEKLQDVATRLGLDAEGKLSSALAGRSTWSGIELLWPLAGAEAAVPATLGASPGFDRARAFTGYRGFGVLHVGRPAAQAARAAEPLASNPLAATPEAAPVDSSRPAESAPAPAPAPAVESRSVAPLVAPAAKVVAPLASLPTRIAFAAPAGKAPSQTKATPEPAPAHVARSVEQALEAADAITAAKPPAPPPVRVAFVAPIPVPRPAGLLPLTPAALPEGHPHAAPAEDIAARDADADPADALEAFGPESEEEAPVVAGVPVHESDLVEPIAAAEAVAAHPPAATDEAKVGAEAPATAEAPSSHRGGGHLRIRSRRDRGGDGRRRARRGDGAGHGARRQRRRALATRRRASAGSGEIVERRADAERTQRFPRDCPRAGRKAGRAAGPCPPWRRRWSRKPRRSPRRRRRSSAATRAT